MCQWPGFVDRLAPFHCCVVYTQLSLLTRVRMPKNLLNPCIYLLSATKSEHWPDDNGAEVAFVGRSNVGKSSAINRLTGYKSLARTSKTPGRTQQIIFFELNATTRLVDLPGYGYAKVPLAVKNKWKQHIEAYFFERESLKGLVLPVDIRRTITDLDQQMLQYCIDAKMPVLILLTKADKLTRNHANQALFKFKKQIAASAYQDLVYSLLVFSAVNGLGEEQARTQIYQWLDLVE